MDDPEQAIAAVIELERRRCAAIGAGDLEAIAACLADDYLHVYGDGGVSDRAGYLHQVGRTPRTPERGPLTVRLYGDAAVVTGKLINRIAYEGRGPEVFDTFATQVAVRGEAGWRFVSCQLTPRRRKA